MRKLKATDAHKKEIHKQFKTTRLGKLFSFDSSTSYEEFLETYPEYSKAIVDEKDNLLMLYKTDMLPEPNEVLIHLSCIIPFDVCFPGYIRPTEIMKFAVREIFKDIKERDIIITFLPYIPFLCQHFLLSNFRLLDTVVKDITVINGKSIDGYAFTIHRSEILN